MYNHLQNSTFLVNLEWENESFAKCLSSMTINTLIKQFFPSEKKIDFRNFFRVDDRSQRRPPSLWTTALPRQRSAVRIFDAVTVVELYILFVQFVLFVLYTAPLSTVIEKHSVLHHSYADDSQLQKSAFPHQIPDLFLSMQKCIDDIKSWMTLNKLN